MVPQRTQDHFCKKFITQLQAIKKDSNRLQIWNLQPPQTKLRDETCSLETDKFMAKFA